MQYADSAAAIKSSSKTEIRNKTVWECYENHQEVNKNNDLTLVWVPGHSGVDGNEIVYQLAKKAANTRVEGPEPHCGLSTNVVKSAAKNLTANEFRKFWVKAPKMKHSKNMLLQPENKSSKALINRADVLLG